LANLVIRIAEAWYIIAGLATE